MGCDIHLFVEYKNKESSHWNSFSGEIDLGRNYSVFARLAGVCGGVEGLFIPPRGVPSDMEWRAKAEYNDPDSHAPNPDWHSASWLTPSEYAAALAKGDGADYFAVLALLYAFEMQGCDARVVFWFDN